MKSKGSERLLNLLKKVDVFSALRENELAVIAEYCESMKFKSGDKVFSEGEPGDALFIVDSGEVVVQKREEYPEGPEIHIARFIEGNNFGDLDLFSGAIRKAEALASGDTRLLRFPREDVLFEDFLEAQPDISAQLLHRILVVITDRIRRANELVKENSPLIQELKKQVYRDKLTGIYNQSYLIETLQEHIQKKGTPFAVLISKPDNFKELNDSYGHEAGDKAIRIMANSLRDFFNEDKYTARYKGNAMAFFMPGISSDRAAKKAADIRDFLNRLDLSEITGSKDFSLTASIGIGFYPDHGTSAEDLTNLVHELPLLGRKRGGNQILFPEDGGDSQ